MTHFTSRVLFNEEKKGWRGKRRIYSRDWRRINFQQKNKDQQNEEECDGQLVFAETDKRRVNEKTEVKMGILYETKIVLSMNQRGKWCPGWKYCCLKRKIEFLSKLGYVVSSFECVIGLFACWVFSLNPL